MSIVAQNFFIRNTEKGTGTKMNRHMSGFIASMTIIATMNDTP